MITQPTQDPTTLAAITVQPEAQLPASLSGLGLSSTLPYQEISACSGFSVSMDILQLGDPFSLTLPNPRGKWTKLIPAGAKIELRMRNPNVNGGKPALMHTGRIVTRDLSCEIGTGSVMQLGCADIGWHLMTHYPKPHIRLEGGTYAALLKWALDQGTGWGFKGISADTETARLIRLGLNGGRQQAEALASNNLIIFQAQTEPGMSLGDLLITYARRFNRLVNVSADGFIQIFQPNYNQAPLYRLDLHEYDDPDNVRNNVLAARVAEDISKQWTGVTAVGQIVGYSLYDAWGYNPGKFLGTADAQNEDKLPFLHDFSFADGEIYLPQWGPAGAGWKLKRDLYDSWTATYRVRGHWQHYNGRASWYVPDTLCEVHDDPHNLHGAYYVSAVKLERNRGGDTTELTLKKPGLLSANFANVVTGLVK